MQLPSLSLASVVLLLAGHAAAAPIASLHARSTGCNVHNHFYNEVAVYYPPSDHACGNTLLSTLRNKGLSVTKWKCENSTATFRLPIVATSVTTLATAIGHSCDTCVGGSGTDGTLWAQENLDLLFAKEESHTSSLPTPTSGGIMPAINSISPLLQLPRSIEASAARMNLATAVADLVRSDNLKLKASAEMQLQHEIGLALDVPKETFA